MAGLRENLKEGSDPIMRMGHLPSTIGH